MISCIIIRGILIPHPVFLKLPFVNEIEINFYGSFSGGLLVLLSQIEKFIILRKNTEFDLKYPIWDREYLSELTINQCIFNAHLHSPLL